MPQQLLPYWNAVKRWWWLTAISVLLAGGSAYLYWQGQPLIYQARIALSVGNSARSVNPDAQQLGIERSLATFYGEMTKRQPITQKVIERLGLLMKPEDLAGAIETRVIFDAQILEIYVYSYDPGLAEALATEIANVLIEQSPSNTALTQTDTREFVNAQINDLQQKMADIDAQLVDLRNRMTQMTSAADLNEAQATAKELETLKQSYSQTYAQYLTLLNNQTVNSLSIIEAASVPNRPISIGLATTLLIAVAGGLALSLGAVVVLEYVDDILHWGDTPFALSLSVLGVVPAWSDHEHPLILSAQPQSPEADALRSLRARINLGDEGSDIKKLAITSPSPRDGKTFTALNLAAAAAAAGLRTILIDGDLRLGSLHTLLGCAPEPGLSDLLRRRHGHTPSESALQATPLDNLYLIPIGRPVLDPASLLSASKLDALTSTLLEDADLVVIDTPPVGVGPDATLLAAAADAVVLVASVDRTRRRLAIKAITVLERYNLIGLIFNRVSLKRSQGQYYQYYSRPAAAESLLTRIKRAPAALLARLRARRAPAPPRPRAGAIAAKETSDPRASPALWADGNGHAPAERADIQQMAERLWQSIDLADRDDTIILTTAEAAERLETTEETVRGWCASGRLPSVRIGKQWLVTGLTLREVPPLGDGDAAPPQ
jgi:capsular exopolysaccharide synthesis family protein